MTTYYVRRSGNDASAGTSAGTAWLTIGKALGASGIASGDTLYIGAGIYRETVTVAMTSATVTTNVIGDVTGAFTGDAGEVRWTGWTTNDLGGSSGSAVLTLNARDFLAFSNITFYTGAGHIVLGNTVYSTDITFTNCSFISMSQISLQCIIFTGNIGAASNWTIDRCIFMCISAPIAITLPETGADYDSQILIKNCLIISTTSQGITLVASGAAAGFGGGVDIMHCTFLGSTWAFLINTAGLSTTFPCTVTGCILTTGNGLSAQASGQILEDYNSFNCSTARSNVTAGVHSTSALNAAYDIGQAAIYGGSVRFPFTPTVWSPYVGFGSAVAGGVTPPTTDYAQRTRPEALIISSSGTATAGAAKTMTDSGKTWGVNSWNGYTLKITGGTGSGQTKQIATNTATVLTVDGNWKTNPDNTSTYQIYWGQPATTGTATAGTTTTLTDANATWATSQWIGYTLTIDTGTGSGQTLTITANTATALTFAVATAPDATSTYSLFRKTNTTTQNYAAGALEFNVNGGGAASISPPKN